MINPSFHDKVSHNAHECLTIDTIAFFLCCAFDILRSMFYNHPTCLTKYMYRASACYLGDFILTRTRRHRRRSVPAVCAPRHWCSATRGSNRPMRPSTPPRCPMGCGCESAALCFRRWCGPSGRQGRTTGLQKMQHRCHCYSSACDFHSYQVRTDVWENEQGAGCSRRNQVLRKEAECVNRRCFVRYVSEFRTNKSC